MFVFPNCLLPDSAEVNITTTRFENNRIIFHLESTSSNRPCPMCKLPSSKVHSKYYRRIADLPIASYYTEAQLITRKFFCNTETCRQRVFSERFNNFVKPHGRRSSRLDERLTIVGLKTGGNLGASIAMIMGINVSSSTILRLIYKVPDMNVEIPKVLGIDDWAYRKGTNYGTILVDLEKNLPVDLLPDRNAETIRKWLEEHPGVEVISRDRAGEYTRGARQGAPDAIQVADRWHLLVNLGDALHRMMNNYNRELRQAAQSEKADDVKKKDSPENIVQEKKIVCKNELKFQQVKELQAQGKSIKFIFRATGIHRETIKKYFHFDNYPVNETINYTSTVDPFGQYITTRWSEGMHNHRVLLDEIKHMGYTGTFSSLYRYTRHLPQKKRTRVSENAGSSTG